MRKCQIVKKKKKKSSPSINSHWAHQSSFFDGHWTDEVHWVCRFKIYRDSVVGTLSFEFKSRIFSKYVVEFWTVQGQEFPSDAPLYMDSEVTNITAF